MWPTARSASRPRVGSFRSGSSTGSRRCRSRGSAPPRTDSRRCTPLHSCTYRSTRCLAAPFRGTSRTLLVGAEGHKMTVGLRITAAALAMTCPWAQAADLTVRLDAREIVRNHVHTDLTLAVKSGPLTLAFPKWLPGEHMPSGPLDTLVGMTIRANDQPLTWQRDPKDPFAV